MKQMRLEPRIRSWDSVKNASGASKKVLRPIFCKEIAQKARDLASIASEKKIQTFLPCTAKLL